MSYQSLERYLAALLIGVCVFLLRGDTACAESLFVDRFNGSIETNWATGEITGDPITVKVESDGLRISGSPDRTCTYLVNNSESWSDYTVEADVTILGATGDYARFALLGHDSVRDGIRSGNEVTLNAVPGSNEVTVRVRGSRLYAASENTAGILNTHVTYHVKMVFSGNTTDYYVNETLIYTENSGLYVSGAAGFRVYNGIDAVIENYKVTFPGGVALNDTFANGLDSAVWSIPQTGMTSVTSVGGALRVTGVEGNKRYIVNSSTEWSDYSVEADITVHGSTAANSRFGLFSYYSGNGNEANELLLNMNPNDSVVHVRTRGSTLYTKESNTAGNLQIGESYHLKIVQEGKATYCYIDDVLIFTETQSVGCYDAGSVGFVVYNGMDVTIDNFMVTLTERKLFQDNFSQGLICFEASNSTGISVSQEGSLHIQGNVNTMYSDIVENLNGNNNYTIEADVTVHGATGNNARLAIFGYYSGSGTQANELTFTPTGDDIAVRIRGRSLMAANENTAGTLSVGTQYHVKIEFYQDEIRYYVDDRLIYTDNDGLYSGGSVGFRAYYGISASIDNFIVRQTKYGFISSVTLCNEQGTAINDYVQVNQGHSIECEGLYLYVTYSNQIPAEIVPLTNSMFTADTSVCGEFTATITYFDEMTTMNYKVIGRENEIADIVSRITAIDVAELTLNDRERVAVLQHDFETLSGSEQLTISNIQDVREKYFAILDRMDELLYPVLVGTEVVFRDDFVEEFNTDPFRYRTDYDAWNGRCSYVDGHYLIDQPANKVSTLLIANPSSFEEVRMIEADVMMPNEDCYASLWGPFSLDGGYRIATTTKLSSVGSHPDNSVMLFKASVSGSTSGWAYAGVTEDLSGTYGSLKGKWHNLKMICDPDNNQWKVYLNDELMLSYSCPEGELFDYGNIGFRPQNGPVYIDNFVVRAKCTLDIPVPTTPTVYLDTFEDEVVGEKPSHWIEKSGESAWQVVQVQGGSGYGTTQMENYTSTWLHGFEKDPVVTADVCVTQANSTAQFGLLGKMITDGAYVRAGYDMAQSKWFVEASKGEDYETQFFFSDSALFSTNTWYHVKLAISGHDVVLEVNDEPVIVIQGELDHNGWGRCGAFANGAAVVIDNVHLTMPNGGTITDGIAEGYLDTANYITRMEVEEVGNQLIASSGYYKKQFISNDNGATWEETNEYHSLDDNGSYTATILLRNGLYLKADNDMNASISTDMKTWTKIGDIVPDNEIYNSNGAKIPILHVNSLTELDLGNNTYRLIIPVGFRNGSSVNYSATYYSDDGGYTWIRSVNDIRDIYPNYSDSSFVGWNEAKVVQCSDGTVRMYSSKNGLGYMAYAVSNDFGKTWADGIHVIESMPCAVSSFAVMEDPSARGTWYLVFLNEVPHTLTSICPRTRLSLMKSTDGKNWTFVMDIDRMISTGGIYSTGEGQGHQIYQILDPSLLITDDIILVNYGRSTAYDPSSHNRQRAYFVRIPKSSIAPIQNVQEVRTVVNAVPIEMVVQPVDQNVEVGSQAVFECFATGHQVSYQWEVNRQDGLGWMPLVDALQMRYIVNSVSLECDGYQYRCIVMDSLGDSLVSNVATLTVMKPIALPETGDNSNVNAWLLCAAASIGGFALLGSCRKKQIPE